MKVATIQDADLKKLSGIIKDVTFAMLTTREPDGTLHSRPMHTEAMEGDGTLVFLTLASSAKARELEANPQVSVTYMGGGADTCVSIAGHARLQRDLARMRELWQPLYKAWFPKGLEDPDLTLLEVAIDRAEYWETPASMVIRIFGAAKAIATGKSVGETMGEHKQILGGR